MSGTLIVAVRQALVDAVADLPGMAGVEVGLSWANGSNAAERVWTRRARFNHVTASMRAGRNYRDETGRFELVVWVEGVGQDQAWTSARACELALTLEEYVADHKNGLGVGEQTLVVDGDGELAEVFNDAGTGAEVSIPIRYTARLT